MEISPFIFWGCRFLHFFQLRFLGFHQKNAEISILNGEWWFLHYFFRLNKFSIFFFQLWFFRFHQKNDFLVIFFVGEFSVLLCSTVNFPISPEEVDKPAFWIDLIFFFQTTCPFCTKLEWKKYHSGDFSVFWLEISSFFDCESNSLHSEARFSLFFSFSAFFSRGMQQSPIFLLSLIFCKKN